MKGCNALFYLLLKTGITASTNHVFPLNKGTLNGNSNRRRR